MMAFEDRATAVARLGSTERQARFLVHVMLFSGLCVPRQYARSAGIAPLGIEYASPRVFISP